MHGDIVYRVHGVHEGRKDDVSFGTYRTLAEAEAQIERLAEREMDGRNWAARYHNRGFVVRQISVETDFVLPTLPKPRDSYFVNASESQS